MGRYVIILSGVAGLAAPSLADVIYDTLWITDQEAYDWAFGNAFGGRAFGYLQDSRLVDDFTIDASKYPDGLALTRVTQDSVGILGNLPGEGFAVRVYGDESGIPAETPMLELAVSLKDAVITSFEDSVLGLNGLRFELDIVAHQVVLQPGTYWLNVQPIDTTDDGDWYFQVWDNDALFGGDAHYRDDYLYWPRWYPTAYFGDGPGTAAMRIEGVAIPAPSAIAPALLTGALSQRRVRR